jgi:hypothetical protein
MPAEPIILEETVHKNAGTLYGGFPFVFRSMSQLVRRIGARLGSATSFGVLSAE